MRSNIESAQAEGTEVVPGAAERVGAPETTGAPEVTRLVLYFSNELGTKLVEETRDVTPTSETASATVWALIAGPAGPNRQTIPRGTRLNDIRIEKGTATIDLSREFVDGLPGGSLGERLAVYSIVNSLTELSTIEEVEILVSGRKVDAIGGHLDLSGALTREESLL